MSAYAFRRWVFREDKCLKKSVLKVVCLEDGCFRRIYFLEKCVFKDKCFKEIFF